MIFYIWIRNIPKEVFMIYMPFVWIAVIAILIFAELATTPLVAIWFMPSAVVATVLSFFNVPIYVQLIVFVIVSVVFIIFSKPIFNKMFHLKHTPTNADTVIGEHAVVVEEVCNLESRGLVKVRGQVWSARSADDTLLEPGEIVSVISIEGVKLICRKEAKEN